MFDSRPRRRSARALTRREPHAEARADRSAPLQRHRQRVLRRDPARARGCRRWRSRSKLDATTSRSGSSTATRRRSHDVDRPPARARRATSSRRRSPRFATEMAVHGRYGKPCPRLRRAGSAHPLRRQRDQLLRALPDRRQAPRRPRAVAAAEGRLAADARGARSADARAAKRDVSPVDFGAFDPGRDSLDGMTSLLHRAYRPLA